MNGYVEMKSCPHCGGSKNVRKFWNSPLWEPSVICRDCNSTAVSVEAWNRRADLTTPDTRDALIKELVEALDMSRRRLEKIADAAWYGDARDFKRRIPGVFAECDTALRKAEEAGYGAE